MTLLSRFFGYDGAGIRLDEREGWEVEPTKDVERFLRALALLASPGAVVYFEGTGEPHVAGMLQALSVEPGLQVAVGTIWPRPDRYHVPLSAGTLETLAAFLEAKPAGYFCSHCHVYRDARVILQWHDAFDGSPMTLSPDISQDVVARFASALGSTYRRR